VAQVKNAIILSGKRPTLPWASFTTSLPLGDCFLPLPSSALALFYWLLYLGRWLCSTTHQKHTKSPRRRGPPFSSRAALARCLSFARIKPRCCVLHHLS